MSHVDVPLYLQIEPVWHYSGESVTGAKAVRLTQKKPEYPLGGSITVKLTIRIAKSVFMPLRPEAVVVVPEPMVEANPIEVTAEYPGDGEPA